MAQHWSLDTQARRQVLLVKSCLPGSDAHSKLKALRARSRPDATQEGDLLLLVNGRPATTFWEVESAVVGQESVQLTVLRNGAEVAVAVDTTELSGQGTQHIIMWCGMIVQKEHRCAGAAMAAVAHACARPCGRGATMAAVAPPGRGAIMTPSRCLSTACRRTRARPRHDGCQSSWRGALVAMPWWLSVPCGCCALWRVRY
jgi:hypothetical protein